MTLNEVPNWNDAESAVQYLINKGVSIDDVNCFDQVRDLKKFTENCISDKQFNDLLSSEVDQIF
jgi:hypothetical protein